MAHSPETTPGNAEPLLFAGYKIVVNDAAAITHTVPILWR